MWDIKIGDKLICVLSHLDDPTAKNRYKIYPFEIFPTKNEIYTVRDICPDAYEHDIMSIRVNEIHNKVHHYPCSDSPEEMTFGIRFFRKLKKTDISEFEKLLIDPPKEPDDEKYLKHIKELEPCGMLR